VLQKFTDNFRARARRQRPQLVERLFRAELWMSGAFVATGLLEVSRAACAAAVKRTIRARADAAPRERVRTSRPIRNARSLAERFPSAVVGPCPLALLLSKDLLPEDLDFGLLNLLGSRRTWIGTR